MLPWLHSGLLLAPAGEKAPAKINTANNDATPKDNQSDDALDDFLSAEEVMSLDLRGTQVVMLSACETGLGSQARGQGVLGLQRAFHAAGAETVIGTLWRVDDAATTLLVEQFYANLWEKGLSRSEALRAAQLFVLHNPKLVEDRRAALFPQSERLPKDAKNRVSHPALWAAFVLSGRGE
jgi:CHAT domain-containing protein